MRVRKRNRMEGYDYAQSGYYFVTICTHNKISYFGEVSDNGVLLSTCGEIVNEQWLWLQRQYSYVTLDEYIVMPNHVHGIIAINNPNDVLNGRDRSVHDRSVQGNSSQCDKIKSLSELIGAFKTTSSKKIHLEGIKQFHWQKSFYDHIVRNEKSLNRIREYIRFNPIQELLDEQI